MDRFLLLLGLAFRAGKVQVGETPVYETILKGRAKAVFLAADAAGNTKDKLARKAGEVPIHPLPISKAQLGHALGRESCALACITDPGFYEGLRAALSDFDHHNGGVTH